MKTYYVTIRGKERLLRFTSADAVALKRKHGKTVLRLIREDVLAQTLEGELTGDTDIEIQASLVATCLQRGGWKEATEARVLEFFDELFASENPDARIGDLVMPAVAAAFYSGAVTGRSKDIYAKREEDAGAPEGNETPSGASSSQE